MSKGIDVYGVRCLSVRMLSGGSRREAQEEGYTLKMRNLVG